MSVVGNASKSNSHLRLHRIPCGTLQVFDGRGLVLKVCEHYKWRAPPGGQESLEDWSNKSPGREESQTSKEYGGFPENMV